MIRSSRPEGRFMPLAAREPSANDVAELSPPKPPARAVGFQRVNDFTCHSQREHLHLTRWPTSVSPSPASGQNATVGRAKSGEK